MKQVAMIVYISVLFMVCGINCANAQPATPAENPMKQDSSGVNSPSIVSADPQSGMGMMMGDIGMMPDDLMEFRNYVMMMMMNLGLDQKQKEAVHETIDRTVKDLIKKRSDLLVAIIDLEDIIQREPIDINAAESKLKQIEPIKSAMFLTQLKALEEIRSILTPEQRDKLMEMTEMQGMQGAPMMEEKKSDHNMKMMTK